MLFNTVPYGMACNAIHNVEERKPLNIRIVRVKYVTTKLFELPFIRTRDVLSRLHIYIKNILTLNFTLHLFQRKKKISPFIFNIIVLSKICNRLSNNLRNLISTRIPEILLAHSKKKSKLHFHLTILQNNNLQTYLPNSQKETCKKVARDREIFLLFDLVPLNGLSTRDSRIVKWNCDDYCTVVV